MLNKIVCKGKHIRFSVSIITVFPESSGSSVFFFLNRRFQVGTCCTKEQVGAPECSTTAMQNSFPFSKFILRYIVSYHQGYQ
jgi:hypothetical protein